MDKFLYIEGYMEVYTLANKCCNCECVVRWKMRSESISFAIQLYIKYQLPTIGSLLTISYTVV